jgi:hypothetical protein
MGVRTTKSKTDPKSAAGAAKRALSPAKAKVLKQGPDKPQIRIFVSYSHVDAAAQGRLQIHLAALKREGVETWFDGDMDAGDALDPGVARALRQAHIFIALLSPDYLASHYCWNIEYRRAVNRRARGTIRIVAAVVRPCDWKASRAAGFKLLPRDGRPVTRWRSADEAYLNIAEGIRGVVTTLRRELASANLKSAAASSPKRKTISQKSPTRLTGKSRSAKSPGKSAGR